MAGERGAVGRFCFQGRRIPTWRGHQRVTIWRGHRVVPALRHGSVELIPRSVPKPRPSACPAVGVRVVSPFQPLLGARVQCGGHRYVVCGVWGLLRRLAGSRPGSPDRAVRAHAGASWSGRVPCRRARLRPAQSRADARAGWRGAGKGAWATPRRRAQREGAPARVASVSGRGVSVRARCSRRGARGTR